MEHFKKLPNTSYLDTCNDVKLDILSLPLGRTPVWIEETVEQPVENIMGLIKRELVFEHETVTIIYDKFNLRDERMENMNQFCENNGWQFHHYSHYFGCEDQVIVLFECSLLFELISRGRNQVIFVTNSK